MWDAIVFGALSGAALMSCLFWCLAEQQLSGARAEVMVERARARNLHRRAQKAEGRLQRMRHIMEEEDETC